MLDLRCSGGDLAFIRREDREMISVEIKLDVAMVSPELDKFWCRTNHPNADDDPIERVCYFSALRPVDMYLFRLQGHRHSWILLPRDVLPDNWFDLSAIDPDKPGGKFLAWAPENLDLLSDHLISHEAPDSVGFTRRVEQILRYYPLLRTRITRKFHVPIISPVVKQSSTGRKPETKGPAIAYPTGHGANDESTPSTDNRQSDTRLEEPSSSTGPPNYGQRWWSQPVFEAMEAGRFNRRCEKL